MHMVCILEDVHVCVCMSMCKCGACVGGSVYCVCRLCMSVCCVNVCVVCVLCEGVCCMCV